MCNKFSENNRTLCRNAQWHLPLKLIAMFAIGGFASLSMAPLNLWPTIFFGLSTLYIIVTRTPTPLKAGALTFAFSLGYFGFSLSWIGNALLVENNPYWWAWPLAVSGLPLILALFPALMTITYKSFSQICIKRENTALNYIIFCFLLAVADYARGHLFTGFPWNLYGYTWIDILPIAQLAALSDVYLLNTVTIFWAIAPAFILSTNHSKMRKSIYCVIILSTFAASWLYGQNRINNYAAFSSAKPKDTRIIIVQPNIKQSEKWKPEKRAQNFIDIVKMSQYQENHDIGAEITLIIWPETAISQNILNTEWTMDAIRNMLSAYPRNVLLITGALRHIPGNKTEQKPEHFYNSILTLDKSGRVIDTYDKRHLVPFGEYIPLDSYIKISPIVGFAGFKKGSNVNERTIRLQPEDGGQYILKYITLVCYEAIFPDYVRFTTSKKPDFIVNVTNDAWYGKSAGPYQHIVQTRFRAIESGLPFIRSANTGISAIIDPVGNKISSIDLMKKNILSEKLPQTID